MGFLDNLSKTISQGVDRARSEAETLLRTTKLKGEIGDLQQQVDTNLRQLGERALDLHRQGQLQAPEIGSLAQMIEQLQQQVSAKQAEITALQQSQSAPASSPDAPQAEEEQVVQTCPTCQANLPANAAFCGNCGARLQS